MSPADLALNAISHNHGVHPLRTTAKHHPLCSKVTPAVQLAAMAACQLGAAMTC